MQRSDTTGKYTLQNKLRTLSAYKKEQEAKRIAAASEDAVNGPMSLLYGKEEHQAQPPRRWGGCVNGCNHAKFKWYTYGDPNTNNENGDNYGKYPDETDNLVQHVQDRLRERLGVLEAGRDFGGSRSGAGSDAEDIDSGSGGSGGSGGEDDLREAVKLKLCKNPHFISDGNGNGKNETNYCDDGSQESASSLPSPPTLSAPPPTAVPKVEVGPFNT